MSKWNVFHYCTILLLVLLLAGCGGGSEDGGGTSPTISGVAAAGSPLSGTVHLKDSSSPARELSVPIAADGSFSFNLNRLTAPFILKADGTANGNYVTLYSFAAAAGVANINPFSHLAVVEANGGDDLAGLYNAPDPARMHAIESALPNAVAAIQTALQPTLAKFGAATVHFIADPYVANHQGLDLLLDMADIRVNSGVVTIIDKTAGNTMQMPLSGFMTGSIDIIAAPITTAGSVSVWPGMPAVARNGTVTFKAVVIGAANQQVTWSVVEENGGTITNTGVYTAPATPGTYHVKATSAADATKSATVTVTVGGMNALRIVPSGPGVFVVLASVLNDVGTIDLAITYDAAALANPKITPGPMTALGLMAVNASDTSVPGMVRLGFVTDRPFSGNGILAIISFDLLGSSPGGILSMSASLTDGEGRPLATSTSLSNQVAVPIGPASVTSTPTGEELAPVVR